MKENSANQDRDGSGNDEQQNSNLPDRERENDTPVSGVKNNDAWKTGIEAKTPVQEGNPPRYVSTDSDDEDQESRSNAVKDPDAWKTGDESRDPDQWKTGEEPGTDAQKTGGNADQNYNREKENSF